MAVKKVGIDIGSSTIKIVCASMKKDKLAISGYRILKTPEGAFGPKGSLNEKAFFEEGAWKNIEDAVREIKCKGKKCNLSISGKSIIIRERKLPIASTVELDEMVDIEARGFLPGPLEDFVVDYRVVDIVAEGEGEVLKVIIVAAPLEMVKSYMALAKKCGLKVEAMDMESSYITNYAKRYLLDQELNTLVVDIGANTTRFVMYSGIHYFAELEVEIGGDEATRSSEQLLDVGSEELEKRKINEGRIFAGEEMDLSASDEDVYFNLGIKKTYEKIAQEISRVMDYYRTRSFSSKIDRIVMMGGGASLSGAPEYIQSVVGIPVMLAQMPRDAGLEESEAKGDFPSIILALGAALRGRK